MANNFAQFFSFMESERHLGYNFLFKLENRTFMQLTEDSSVVLYIGDSP